MSEPNSNPTPNVAKLAAPRTESCQYGPWKFTATKSHILGSKCPSPDQCKVIIQSGESDANLCQLCRFEKLVKKPHLPDMIFNSNVLRLEHSSGAGIEFTALAALQQLRDRDHDNIQVAHAKEWREARQDCQHTRNVMDGYDWTYTTDYCGTLLGGLTAQPSNERIDIEKLKTMEPIRFFQELYLYEDELDDNGATNCVVKIRCMDSGFLVLFRHYLRVDHVMVRVRETRLYHATGTNYLIRERATKGMKYEQTEVPVSILKCPDQVSSLLSVQEEIIDKIVLPEQT